MFKILHFALFTLLMIFGYLSSIPVVAVLLLTSWDGTSTLFGNAKWGKGETNPTYLKSGYWAAYNWLVLRNPVNNLHSNYLGVKRSPIVYSGDIGIGDKTYGGSYFIKMGKAWEYYLIKPYGKRCLRIRMGWKILGNEPKAAFVFCINPFKKYLGS